MWTCVLLHCHNAVVHQQLRLHRLLTVESSDGNGRLYVRGRSGVHRLYVCLASESLSISTLWRLEMNYKRMYIINVLSQ